MELVSVIKNDNGFLNAGLGSKSVIAWKFLQEDFNTKSQLIVSESEEAVFIKDGIAVAVFPGGRYSLDTNNYPFITALLKRFTGGVSAFSCKVYFVNKDHKLELFWGTDTPIQMRDPKLLLQTSIQARGSYSIQVKDSKKLLVKLVGNNIQIFTQEEVNSYFRSAFMQSIKDAIARHVKDSGREILELCTEHESIASGVAGGLRLVLDEYGLELINFYVAAMDIPENDPNRAKLEDAYASKGAIGILGADWGRQQSADILRDLANNPGSGGVAGAVAGAGVGLAAGSVFGEMAQQMFRSPEAPTQPQAHGASASAAGGRFSMKADAAAPTGPTCAECGHLNPLNARFCLECGSQTSSTKACIACAAEMPVAGKFCAECGARQ